MGTMASQITSLNIVYPTVYAGADQRKHQSSASLAFERRIHRIPAQMASNAENVSIWWRHHALNRRWCLGMDVTFDFGSAQSVRDRQRYNGGPAILKIYRSHWPGNGTDTCTQNALVCKMKEIFKNKCNFFCWDLVLPGDIVQYHGCCCPDSLHR